MKIHERYGDVVRLAPDEISFTEEKAWNHIYVHRPGHADHTKDPVWYKGTSDVFLSFEGIFIDFVSSTG